MASKSHDPVCPVHFFFNINVPCSGIKRDLIILFFCFAININEFYTTNGIAYQNKSENKLEWTACIPWGPLHNLKVREIVFF